MGPRSPTTSSSGKNQGMFSRAENIVITGGTFVANELNYPLPDPKCMELLQANTSVGAFHNSGERHDAPKCHPETRVVVLREIMDWMRDKGHRHQILWIYGPAGTGKSSIAQTIAELCEEEGSLASDFFFSRTIAGRNTDTRLVSSLACQLTITIPEIRPFIAAAINEDSLIFSRSLQTQFDSLILKPLKQLTSSTSESDNAHRNGKSYPYLFIIDGLDECGTPESQHYVLSSLASALDKDRSCTIPLIFLIASRPEQVIRDMFNGILNDRTRRIVLDDKYEPDTDIRRFLNAKFAEIKKTHPMAQNLPANWPSSSDLDYIVQKASGQFIYASTVMKFIASPRARPPNSLNIVLKLTAPGSYTPFADLDALYKHILLSLEEEDLKKALIIFALLFLTSKLRVQGPYGDPIYRTPTVIENFLGYESGEVSIVMSDLHSIVSVPPWGSSTSASSQLHLFHASLGDFLEDRSRSEDLFIDTGMYSAQFSMTCMGHISTWLESTADPSLDTCTGAARYSYYIFMEIFSQIQSDETDVLETLRYFPFKKYILTVFAFAKDPFLKQSILRRIPELIQWIQAQKNGGDLADIYKNHCVDYIQSKLLREHMSERPTWQHIFTALTLGLDNGEPTRYFWRLCSILDKADTLGRHLFSLSLAERSAITPHDYLDFIIPILVKELTDVDRGMNYYVDNEEYIKLGIELFDCLTIEKKKTGNGLDPGDWRLPLDLLIAIFSRIPGEKVLGQYLRDGMKYRQSHDGIYSEATEFRTCVETYVKGCNLPDVLAPLPRVVSPLSSLINHSLLASTNPYSRLFPPRMVSGTRSLPSPSYPQLHQPTYRDDRFNASSISVGSSAGGERDSRTSLLSSQLHSSDLLPPAPLRAVHTRDRHFLSPFQNLTPP